MDWVLILTMMTGQGVSISTHDFISEALCRDAGSAWVKEANSTFSRPFYLCKKVK